MTDFETHLTRQHAVSQVTFGPGPRTEGVLDHIAKESREVREAPDAKERMLEWTDIAILGLDGLLRACREHLETVEDDDDISLIEDDRPVEKPFVSNEHVAMLAVQMIVQKQGRNELRNWPDWRTVDPNKAIEHDRSGEAPKP